MRVGFYSALLQADVLLLAQAFLLLQLVASRDDNSFVILTARNDRDEGSEGMEHLVLALPFTVVSK